MTSLEDYRPIDCTLIMLGNRPADDPEQNQLHDHLVERQHEPMMVVDGTDQLLVAAFQHDAHRCAPEVAAGGFRADRGRGVVDGHPGHRRRRSRAKAVTFGRFRPISRQESGRNGIAAAWICSISLVWPTRDGHLIPLNP